MKKLTFKTLVLITAAFIAAAPLWAAETTLEQPLFQSGKAIITFEATPLMAMTEIPFAIELTDNSGMQITDAQLSISMDMPAMPMPPNNPQVSVSGEVYSGSVLFTMAGAWQAAFVCVDTKGNTFTLTFDIPKVMMK